MTFQEYISTDGFLLSRSVFVEEFKKKYGWSTSSINKFYDVYLEIVEENPNIDISTPEQLKAKFLEYEIPYTENFLQNFEHSYKLGYFAPLMIYKPYAVIGEISFNQNASRSQQKSFLDIVSISIDEFTQTFTGTKTFYMLLILLALYIAFLISKKKGLL